MSVPEAGQRLPHAWPAYRGKKKEQSWPRSCGTHLPLNFTKSHYNLLTTLGFSQTSPACCHHPTQDLILSRGVTCWSGRSQSKKVRFLFQATGAFVPGRAVLRSLAGIAATGGFLLAAPEQEGVCMS